MMIRSFLHRVLGRADSKPAPANQTSAAEKVSQRPTSNLDVPPKKDAQLNIYNFRTMQRKEPQHFEFIRFDSNNDCNVQCVYCHNPRSKDLIEADEFAAFLKNNVASLDNFQLGCIMEPTLDSRMCDFMLLVRESPVQPIQQFLLQTNDILLHRHSFERMRDAGLDCLSVSIDSPDPATLKLLRGGTSLRKVTANIQTFRKFCPRARVVFVTTVTRANLREIDSLVAFGLDLGVERFVLREVFYMPQPYFEDSKGPQKNRVDHSKMPSLLLEEGDFPRMRDSLLAKYGERTAFEFADNVTLADRGDRTKKDSFRP